MLRGIVLCGGMGTRLRPLTYVSNKHLLPIYNKPMIMYPINTLIQMGIKDILIVSGGEHIGRFLEFLGDGSELGVKFTYKVQKEAGGIAQALALAEDFVEEQFAFILSDNIFEYPVVPPPKCGIVLKKVTDSNRFGVYSNGLIIEKPEKPESDLAVTGLYFYTPEIFEFIKDLIPSARGELEITDVNNWCLKNLEMATTTYDGFWSDAGTFDSLLSTANWVKNNENNTTS